MAETGSIPTPPGQDQAQAPAQSGQSFREAALSRLTAERGEESAPADQPLDNSQEQDATFEEVNDLDEEQTGDESQLSADQPEDDELDEESQDQPESDEAPGVLTVDGNDYSADDIRAMVEKTTEQESKWNQEFRRRTQITARLKQEYEAAGEDVSQMGDFFKNLANANVQQYANFDPSQLSPEQYRVFHEQKTNAERGAAKLNETIEAMQKARAEKAEKLAQAQAEESVTVLQGIEPRWNDDFYTKVREFAVESGRYDAREFENISDWRTIEGLIALMDRETLGTSRETVNREPKKPTRHRNRQRPRRRNSQGQFQSARQAALSSPNARADGSFREMIQAKLRTERGE